MKTHKNGNGTLRKNNEPWSLMKSKTGKDTAGDTLLKLYQEGLKDIHWAENHLVKVLPKMAKASYSEPLMTAFNDHLSLTKAHVSRLEKIFISSSVRVGSTKCEGMDGLINEGEEVIKDYEQGSVRDCGLIIAAQKIEHYEISAYGSLRALALLLGFDEAVKMLQETLDEEGEADKLLGELAETINEQAFNQTELVEQEV